jgi:YD repeat-containing protein
MATTATLATSATYAFDTGRVLTSTDARSQTTSYAYDWLKRPTGIAMPGGGEVSYLYDDAARSVTEKDKERALLKQNGWTYDPGTDLWSPGK